jgi:hypothetical protein
LAKKRVLSITFSTMLGEAISIPIAKAAAVLVIDELEKAI